jgi:hypothetical protein
MAVRAQNELLLKRVQFIRSYHALEHMETQFYTIQ